MSRLAKIADVLILIIAIAFVAAFIATAMARVYLPAPLTDVTLGTVQHLQRVMHGEPLYPLPTTRFVALQYPPLYYYAAAVAAKFMGAGYPALRVTSLISTLTTMCLIAVWTRRETGSWRAAVLAVGLFAATYRLTGAWFDVERVDALFVALLVAALFVFRFAKSARAVFLSAALFLAATATKQTAWVAVVVVSLFLATRSWRDSLLFVATIAVGTLAGIWLLTRFEGGHYVLYAFRVGVDFWGREMNPGAALLRVDAFARHQLLAVLPFAVVLPLVLCVDPVRPRVGLQRQQVIRLAVCWAAVTLAALATQLVQNSLSNVMMPVYAITAIVFALSVHELEGVARGASTNGAALLVQGICLVQFSLLLYVPWHLVRPLQGPPHDSLLVVGTGGHVTPRELGWVDAQAVEHMDFPAASDLLAYAPRDVAQAFAGRLTADLCAATDDHPVTVPAMLFDAEWRASMRDLTGTPVPLPPTIDAALRSCRTVAVQ